MARNLDQLLSSRKEHQARLAQLKEEDNAHPGEEIYQLEIVGIEGVISYLNRRIAEWPGAE